MSDMSVLDHIVVSAWWQQLLIVVIGVARIVRLLYADRLSDSFRAWLWCRFPPATTYLGYLFTCPWCVAVWVGSVATACWLLWPAPTLAVMVASCVAGVAAYVCVLVDDES